MDTREQGLTKLTRLHDESHSPTTSPTSEPTKELLIPDGEHHGIGDGDGLVMMKNEDPPLRSPKRIPDLPSRGRTGLWRRLRLVDRDNSFSLIFFLEICDFIVSGASSAGPPGGYNPPGHARRGGAPWWVVPTQVPLSGRSWLQKFSFIV
mgnify:CR=1 FL=1